MKRDRWKSKSIIELWRLYEALSAALERKISVRREKLEDRLRKLAFRENLSRRERRPYPKVVPKYRNPKNCSEVWSGRGKMPRWLTAELKSGKKLEDFLIAWLHR